MTEETFTQFKESFNYGSRADMNFKFLKDLSDEDAAYFFQSLLWKLGDTLDDGKFDRIVEHIYQFQKQGYSGPGRFKYENTVFTKLSLPISKLRFGLISSTGHFMKGEDPNPFGVENMSQQQAEARISDFLKVEPELTEIPTNISTDMLMVRHGGYDVRGAVADHNVNFPVDRLKELATEGVIGESFSTAYSFVGACSQMRLQNQALPAWVKKFHKNKIEGLILVPV